MASPLASSKCSRIRGSSSLTCAKRSSCVVTGGSAFACPTRGIITSRVIGSCAFASAKSGSRVVTGSSRLTSTMGSVVISCIASSGAFTSICSRIESGCITSRRAFTSAAVSAHRPICCPRCTTSRVRAPPYFVSRKVKATSILGTIIIQRVCRTLLILIAKIHKGGC
jgi:hypothetical protein